MQDNHQQSEMQNRLWNAAKAGDCKTIRMLAMGGVDIDARNEEGFTAFNLATAAGHSEAAMALLAAREMQYARHIGVDPAEFYKVEKKPDSKKKRA